MKVAIRYYTKTGNTKKLAEAIEKAIDVKAKDVSDKLTNDVDILFLGSSVYAGGVAEEVGNFIENIDVKVGKVVNFSTAAILKSTSKQVKKMLEEKNILMDEREFYCKGSFGILHRNRPNEKDLEKVMIFAKSIVNNK